MHDFKPQQLQQNEALVPKENGFDTAEKWLPKITYTPSLEESCRAASEGCGGPRRAASSADCASEAGMPGEVTFFAVFSGPVGP